MTDMNIKIFLCFLEQEKVYDRYKKNLAESQLLFNLSKNGSFAENMKIVFGATSPIKIVMKSFDWSETEEGHDFWEDIHKKWVRYCQLDAKRKARYQEILSGYLPEAEVEVTRANRIVRMNGDVYHVVCATINGHVIFARGENYELVLKETIERYQRIAANAPNAVYLPPVEDTPAAEPKDDLFEQLGEIFNPYPNVASHV